MTTLTDIAADHDRAHSPRLRDVVCVVSCGMEFRADVWRWVHTPRRDTVHIALGILLATLISDGLDNPKGRNPCT